MWTKMGTESGMQVKGESEDDNPLICSSRHSVTSAQACSDLQPTSFITIHQENQAQPKQTKDAHLQVPVHDVVLVDVTDALQDLVDAVAGKRRMHICVTSDITFFPLITA